jgi:hypothetical protein
MTPTDSDAPDVLYRAAVVDLLGVLAYGELTAFERMAADAALAPAIEDQAAMAGLAATQYDHFVVLRDRIQQMGADAVAAMTPFSLENSIPEERRCYPMVPARGHVQRIASVHLAGARALPPTMPVADLAPNRA